ncbi:MAG: thioesterase family protein [Pseudomonadota bacterium]|nr:thioesterase family protein [Pseudomonadota bacterium]
MTGSIDLQETWRERIQTAWCDYNNHLNMAYYILIFDHATDAFHAQLGLDKEYRLATDCSTFAVETHTNYLAEVHDGDDVFITTQVLDQDAKRLHYFHRMYHAQNKYLAATTEVMTVHVSLQSRKVVPMMSETQGKAADLVRRHSKFALPQQKGQKIGIRKN